MFKFYLTTVVIWMIIIYCIAKLFEKPIAQKMKANEEKKTSLFKELRATFIVAAIPIIRLFVAITLIYTATCTQEDFDKLMKRANKDKS